MVLDGRDSAPAIVRGAESEHPESMSERDEFLAWLDSTLIEAERAMLSGDEGPRKTIWSRAEPVSVLGAWRNAVGRAEVAPGQPQLVVVQSPHRRREYRPETVEIRQGSSVEANGALAIAFPINDEVEVAVPTPRGAALLIRKPTSTASDTLLC